MKVLVACEYSGAVRDAFLARGHEAISCDLLPTDVPGPHYQGDVRNILHGRQHEAVSFFMELARAALPMIAIENPVCIMSSMWRKPDQVIQPWQFGHGETKATCLWLKGLPPLAPTNIVEGREARVHKMPPSEDRWKLRSATYPGIADAMAEQWGSLFALRSAA